MNVSLTAELEKYVRRKVASGLYNNASEVVREALRYAFERDSVKLTDDLKPLGKKEVLAKLFALQNPLKKLGVKSLGLFGSVARDQAEIHSDVDVLIEVESGISFSLVDLVSLKDFLEEKLGQKVDVVTKAGLEPLIRDRVLSEVEKVF